jgi:uncharacterized membrane protein YhaH (DUF805 family)
MEQLAGGNGRRAFWCTVGAFVWGAALVGAAFLVPVYGTSSSSGFGTPLASAPSTLVGVNGLWVLIPIAVPVVIAALVWVALHRKCSHGGRVSGFVAWSLIWTLVAECVVAIASVGLLLAPVAGLLVYAATLTPSGGSPSGPGTGATA